MRPREFGVFLPGRDPKVALPDGTRVKIAGPCGSFRDGEAVTFWVVTDYTQAITRKYVHSVEAV
ncbi:MAG: hypothetical protein EOR43_23080 [Mesorhizobium sp.]|uniref:hypothetical protein n=1 Tax=Mesorhizobium sp. TaxID=1871066 RepID=UPI000FE2B69E|nr:hypothetical protein [Mesorhizobium sp.]RWK19810.1 MAG: hypothetical protein EOR43_23080 [Mesorhizobium sp.]RWK28815.1 MAG: hypothetical protein EOR44_21980 [Mesorhizobium sp.]